MTFLWADISHGLNPITFRYYNDLIWYIYGVLGMPFEFIIGFYKLYAQLFSPQLHEKLHLTNHWSNRFALLLTFWAPIYYFNDALISLFEGVAFTTCRFPYFYHHIISITVQPFLLSRPYYEWWDIMLCASHGLLVLMPHIHQLNYIYTSFVFIFNYKILTKPSNEMWENRFVGKFFPFIYYCFFLILIADGCDSSLPYLGE